MNQKDDESTLIEAFSILDEDSSGSIERSELRAMMKNFSKATEEIDDTEIDALLQEADTDGDGQISFEEVFATAAALTRRPRPTHAPPAPHSIAASRVRASARAHAHAATYPAVPMCGRAGAVHEGDDVRGECTCGSGGREPESQEPQVAAREAVRA